KRHREEVETSLKEHEDFQDSFKRQKPYNQIPSILDEDEEELNQDYLTDIFSTLQQELSSSENNINFDKNLIPCNDVLEHDQVGSFSSVCSQSYKDDNEEEECNNVMRHLLEASDDELGLPNMGNGGSYDGENIIEGIPSPINVGLWEIEDEAANYYTILQSELFM
ncbi:hypothetical protein Leryth_021825, partial [Lithospermum erythrorhizon]